MREDLLRTIPAMHELLRTDAARALEARTSREYARERVRVALDAVRVEILAGLLDLQGDDLVADVVGRASIPEPASLRRVINATGVVLHTNLGRAPLSERAIAAMASIGRGYSNLEFDLETGGRGRRDTHAEALLTSLLGCEAAVVVNNNAAAVMLVLNTLASGGEVIVSRGELVEIGGGFRIPEVLERAGCVLREVGTTNRTRVSDFERAINERTRLLLRVHPSNYRIVGFASRPHVPELAALARSAGIPLIEDLGSGCLFDPSQINLGEEVICQDALRLGVDVVTFSGDKLLGGPQAGIIAGRADLLEPIRRNPLMRSLRVDKLIYAALEATLMAYAEGRAFEEVPALKMLAVSSDEISRRAHSVAERLAAASTAYDVEVIEGQSVPGAGSAPGVELGTALVRIAHAEVSASELESRLRSGEPPVVARIEHDCVVVDLRTVEPESEAALLHALISCQ